MQSLKDHATSMLPSHSWTWQGSTTAAEILPLRRRLSLVHVHPLGRMAIYLMTRNLLLKLSLSFLIIIHGHINGRYLNKNFKVTIALISSATTSIRLSRYLWSYFCL